MNAFPVMAARAQEISGRRGLLRARVGSVHRFGDGFLEVVRGVVGRECVCLTCGLRGDEAEITAHDVGGGAHVWAGIVGGVLVQVADG